MAYEVIVLGHLHMPLYFLGTFTECPYFIISKLSNASALTSVEVSARIGRCERS